MACNALQLISTQRATCTKTASNLNGFTNHDGVDAPRPEDEHRVGADCHYDIDLVGVATQRHDLFLRLAVTFFTEEFALMPDL